MELQNYLGVYVSRDQAAAVYLGGETGSQVLGCFSVSTAGRDDAGYPALAAMVAQGCAQRGWVFAETALAVDCSMFMQHRVHSEFADARQIGSTIRFDTEETLATDISDVALAYEVLSSSERGSQLCVFTAKQDILRQIIAAFAGHGMDPVSVEPDIRCLSRFVTDACAAADGQPRTLFGMLGRTSGYLVFSTSSNGKPKAQTPGRTFLIGGRQNRQELLGREVVVTTAMVETTDPITRICVYDTARQVDSALLGQRTGIETGEFDVSAAAGGLDVSQQCEDAVAFSIACGAGFGLSQKAEPVDFRRDFMPYLGRRRRLEKSLKFLSISIGVLLVAVGLYFTAQLFRMNSYRGQLKSRLEANFADVMYGKKPTRGRSPLKQLDSALTEARKLTAGFSDKGSAGGKLTSLLDAINRCAKATELSIDAITITERTMSVSGDTAANNNRHTLAFFEEIKKSGLVIGTQRLGSKGNRDSFAITLQTAE